MELLDQIQIFDNPLRDWLTTLAIALAINVAVGLLKWAVTKRLAKLLSRTTPEMDRTIIVVVRRTRQWLVFLVTLFVGSHYLELSEQVDSTLQGIATVGAFLQIGLWLNAWLAATIMKHRLRAEGGDGASATSLSALNFIGRLILWTLLLLLALDNLGVDVTALVAGLGVGGIAVALAVQNILGDLFASLSIVIDKPFVIGDFIVVGDFMGTVEHVGLKTTRVRSLGGEQLVFANSDLLASRVRNYKRMNERRILFQFGVLYQTSAEQLEAIPQRVREIVESLDDVRFDRAHFARFGESSYDFEVVYWMLNPDYTRYMDAQQQINLGLVRAFEEMGVEFAYPTRTLYLESPVELKQAPGSEHSAEASN